MKTILENTNPQEALRQRKAEVLTKLVQTNHKFARQAEDKLASLYTPELSKWSKRMEFQNSGRSAGLNLRDYQSAAMRGFHKAAQDYDSGCGASFKTWLYTNIFSSCNDLAKKNGKKMKVEIEEGWFKANNTSTNSDKPEIVSLEELIRDEYMVPKSQNAAPWTEYRESNKIVKRLKEIISEKTSCKSEVTRKKAKRVQKFIKHVEDGGNKVSFAEKTGCSRTTLDSNINFFLESNPDLKEMVKRATRFQRKQSGRSKE
ncbi:MAG: hypothetical protein MJZ22_01455 [Candidatus Saccharibacteria bacterium]|nr:hypothetical protein [Candidatus Saccharibacteria bacterium]